MDMKLHTEIAGHGPDLFLVHGWSLHSGVWDTLLPRLAQRYRVTCVDLPGHGASRGCSMPEDLAKLAAQVLTAAPSRAVWLGWSLGGLVALRAALDAPARVSALVLSNTTPKFVAAEDWGCAMPADQFQAFATELARDYRDCVQRFLSLQVHGDAAAQTTLRRLRAVLFARGEPEPAGLAAGLGILGSADLRAELVQISVPALVLAGGYDRLTPAAAGRYLSERLPGAEFVLLPQSAHAPFLSQAQIFGDAVLEFLARRVNPAPAVRAQSA